MFSMFQSSKKNREIEHGHKRVAGAARGQARQRTCSGGISSRGAAPRQQEPGTKPWFAVRFGPSTFGIIDAFPDEAARETHLGGPVGKALAEKADELFALPPDITKLDVLANKL